MSENNWSSGSEQEQTLFRLSENIYIECDLWDDKPLHRTQEALKKVLNDSFEYNKEKITESLEDTIKSIKILLEKYNIEYDNYDDCPANHGIAYSFDTVIEAINKYTNNMSDLAVLVFIYLYLEDIPTKRDYRFMIYDGYSIPTCYHQFEFFRQTTLCSSPW